MATTFCLNLILPLYYCGHYHYYYYYEFLLKNNYIETYYQKGFIPEMSGTFEHIAEMDNIINQSRLQQRSLVITLIDLRNAFGSVNHNLIQTVLKYHHIPNNIGNIIGSLYEAFHISILTNDFNTHFHQSHKWSATRRLLESSLVQHEN